MTAVGDARKRQNEAHAAPGATNSPSAGDSSSVAEIGAQGVEAIRARAEAATPGPWHRGRLFWKIGSTRGMPDEWWVTVEDNRGNIVTTMPEEASPSVPNAEFIAHARTDIPLLLAALNEARAEVARLERGSRCPQCSATEWNEASRLRTRATAAEAVGASVRELADEGARSNRHWQGNAIVRVIDLLAALTPKTTETEESR